MKYNYYPGCALERNAIAYHESAMAVADPLGLTFNEIDDWNCCGATEYITIDLIPAYTLVARNLALAAKQKANGEHLVAPCSACYLNLRKAEKYLSESPNLLEKVNIALSAGGLTYQPGNMKVRHLLDVVVNDVGLDAIEAKVKKPLYGLKLAPYYGCLLVRPGLSGKFDDYEYPTTLDKLLGTLGADVVDFPLKAHCCGGHMTQISEEIALDLIRRLLKNASDYEADAIVTICPMCQLNLDAYQDAVNKHFGTNYRMPILYFTQVMGLALGIPAKKLGFGKEFVDATSALEIIQVEPIPQPKKRKRADKEALPMPLMDKEE